MTATKLRSSQLALFAVLTISILDIDAKTSSALFLLASIVLLGALRKQWRPLPSVALVVLAFIAGYALPVWFFPQVFERLPVSAVDRMMQWALRSFLVFSLAYNSVARCKPVMGTMPVEWVRRKESWAAFALLSLGLVSVIAWTISIFWLGMGLTFIEAERGSSSGGSASQVLFLLSEMKYPYFLGYLLLRQQRRVGKAHRVVFYVLGGLVLIEIMAIGAKGAVIRPAAIFVLALLFESAGGLGWKKAVGGLLAASICLFSFQVITEYRQIMRNASISGQDIQGFAVRYDAFVGSLARSLQADEHPRQTGADTDSVGERFGSGAYGLAWTLELTGGQSPYENALDSVLAPLYAILPRTIYTDKPIFFNSARFASEYFGWNYGGISISLLGSLFFAWGYWGMLAAMGAIGATLATLANRIERYGAVAMGSITCFTVFTLHLLDVGMEFQPLLTNMIRVCLLLGVVRLAWGISIRYRLWRG